MIEYQRRTNETDISCVFDYKQEKTYDEKDSVKIQTSLPFFSHLLETCFYHGKFYLTLKAEGDIEVDPHHLVEDIGIVLGICIKKWWQAHTVSRFGHAVIPMDDALSEVVLDISGRSYLLFRDIFPQPMAGTFQVALLREFFVAISSKAQMNVHIILREGLNSHHMAESLYKAFGISLAQALLPLSELRSTKGVL